MNKDEIRMNKGLLKEISMLKKMADEDQRVSRSSLNNSPDLKALSKLADAPLNNTIEDKPQH